MGYLEDQDYMSDLEAENESLSEENTELRNKIELLEAELREARKEIARLNPSSRLLA